MRGSWYCNDCEDRIEREEIDEHEADGHDVRGVIRPNRLLGNDPGNMEVHYQDTRRDDATADDSDLAAGADSEENNAPPDEDPDGDGEVID